MGVPCWWHFCSLHNALLTSGSALYGPISSRHGRLPSEKVKRTIARPVHRTSYDLKNTSSYDRISVLDDSGQYTGPHSMICTPNLEFEITSSPFRRHLGHVLPRAELSSGWSTIQSLWGRVCKLGGSGVVKKVYIRNRRSP